MKHTFWQEIRRGKSIGRSGQNQFIHEEADLPSGIVLDLGGEGRHSYWRHIKIKDDTHIVRIDMQGETDLFGNLEQGLPVASQCVGAVMLFNVLEHVFQYKIVLAEVARILNSGGKLYACVPFINKVHGAPNDYFRYSQIALERLLNDCGFSATRFRYLSGPFLAATSLVQTMLKRPNLLYRTVVRLAVWLDKILRRRFGDARVDEWPIFYFFTAEKSAQ